MQCMPGDEVWLVGGRRLPRDNQGETVTYTPTTPPLLPPSQALARQPAAGLRMIDDPRLPSRRSAACPTAAGPIGGGLGRRDCADSEVSAGHPGDCGVRRNPATPSRDRIRHSAPLRRRIRTWRALAEPEQDVIFHQEIKANAQSGARARPFWPVRLHRRERNRRHGRRCRAGTSALPLPAGVDRRGSG